MGYSHYFYQYRDFTDKEWSLITSITQQALDSLPNPLIIRGAMGTGDPVIDGESISFNGDETTGMDHETFFLPKKMPEIPSWQSSPGDQVFSFCKTAQKPYDLLVTTALLIAHAVAPDALTYSSDGGDDDWERSIQLFNAIQSKWSIDRPDFHRGQL